jgi:uncharacterized membrane protein
MNNKFFKIKTLLAGLLLPALASAQFDGIRGMLTGVSGLMNQVVRIIFGLALIYFFWGGARFILNAGDAKTREDGKNKMIWGVITLFVMISIYGIIAWLTGVLGLPDGDSILDGNIFNLPN